MLIAISENEYRGLVKRAEEAIRAEFEECFRWTYPDWTGADKLIKEAESLGCSLEFIEQLKKDGSL